MYKYRFFPPHVRFVTPGDVAGGSAAPPSDDEDKGGDTGGEGLGFPAATPVDDMTDAQKAAYWRNESKKHQKAHEKYKGLGDPDAIRATLKDAEDAAEKARRAAMDDQERALEDARQAARAEGAAEAQEKWLKDAVKSRIALLTHNPHESADAATERVEGILAYIDAKQFVGDEGGLDADKIQSFADSLGTGGSGERQSAPGGDPLLGALGRQLPPAQGSGGSIAAIEQAAYDRMTGNN